MIKNPKHGIIKNVEHHINLEKIPHSKNKPYPIPHNLYKKTKEEIKRLLEQKIIRRSNSSITSPCFPILKKNDQIRLVTDFRILNSCTIKERFPIPDMNDLLKQIAGSKIFTLIDLNQGFYQIPLNEKDKYKTSFILPWGQYEYNFCPLDCVMHHALSKEL